MKGPKGESDRRLKKCDEDSAELVGLLRSLSSYPDLERRVQILESQHYIINDIPNTVSEKMQSITEDMRNHIDEKFEENQNSINLLSADLEPILSSKRKQNTFWRYMGYALAFILVFKLSTSELITLITSLIPKIL